MRILHLFNWDLKDIVAELEEINNQGFDAIQINPIQPLKEDGKDNWWLSYQPCDFTIGNQYGTKDDLATLCDIAWNYNIKIIADVVLNHVAGANDGSLNAHESVCPKIKNNKYFYKEKKQIYDWNDRYQVTRWCMGLPSLDLCNQELQDIIFAFLNELVHIGVGGFRFDAAKSIQLPNEGNNFFEKLHNMEKYFDLYNYGEVINSSNELIDQYSNYMSVTTNYYSGYHKDSIVAFVESHDCYLEFGHTNHKDASEINDLYSELSKIYKSTLYYARPFDNSWKDEKVKNANYQHKKHHQKVLKRML